MADKTATQAKIEAVCDEIKEMLVAKNRSYGDSATMPMRVFSKASSIEQILVRIDDKLSRIMRGKDFLGDDTVLDLIGYLILLRVQTRGGEIAPAQKMAVGEPSPYPHGKPAVYVDSDYVVPQFSAFITRSKECSGKECQKEPPLAQQKPAAAPSQKPATASAHPLDARAARSLLELQDIAHSTAVEKGWWDGLLKPNTIASVSFELALKAIPEKLALVHSEVSEALEDYRANALDTSLIEGDKPVGLPTELADIIIRVLDLAGALGLDMQLEVERKLAFNKKRSFRHGGKKC